MVRLHGVKPGDAIAKVATPIARSLGLPCIDPQTNQLRPESGCGKRRAWLNNFGDSVYDYLFKKNGGPMTFVIQVTVEAENAKEAMDKISEGQVLSINPRPQPVVSQVLPQRTTTTHAIPVQQPK